MCRKYILIRVVWSEFSPGAFWTAKNAKFLQADKQDSNQTVRMRRLVEVFFVVGEGAHMSKVMWVKIEKGDQTS